MSLWIFLAASLCLACTVSSSTTDLAQDGSRGPETGSGQPRSIYDPAHRVEVFIQMDPGDWSALREEGPSVSDAFFEDTHEFEYSEFPATVEIDGRSYSEVKIRKKGFLGSLSRLRPALRLEFSETSCEPSCEFKRLTLNNNREDTSHARQCLSYGLFTKAGLPAPRCNLAHVVVNGEDLGTFSNVEPIRKPLLARYFQDTSGNLYEGQGADFRQSDLASLQLKTNETRNDRSDAARLSAALQRDASELPSSLSEVLNLDQFRSFWAMETLTLHADGYSGHRNNYYAYFDPQSGRFHFLPWGTDNAFTENNAANPGNTGRTVYARGLIANALYKDAEQRQMFRDRLRELAQTVWDETVLVRELKGLTLRAPDAWPPATQRLEQHLRSHRTALLAELDEPAPEWVMRSEEPSPCRGLSSDVEIEFETDLVDFAQEPPRDTEFPVRMALDGKPIESSWYGAAGYDTSALDPSIFVQALTFFADGRGIFLQVTIPRATFRPGRQPLHGLESSGLVYVLGEPGRFMGFIGDGTIELHRVPPQLERAPDGDGSKLNPGSPPENSAIQGRMRGQLKQLECAEL